jgi:hypothetical protein
MQGRCKADWGRLGGATNKCSSWSAPPSEWFHTAAVSDKTNQPTNASDPRNWRSLSALRDLAWCYQAWVVNIVVLVDSNIMPDTREYRVEVVINHRLKATFNAGQPGLALWLFVDGNKIFG